jgi:hypothetical protein
MLPRVTVRKVMIDGLQWGIWQAYALPLAAEYTALWTPAGTEMRWAPGTFVASYNTIHYWWPGAQHLIAAHYTGDQFAGCYCDVVLPLADLPASAPRREFVDLYIDLVVRDDRSWYTKDHEIYDRAEQVHAELRVERPAAEAALRRLEEWAAAWSGPFTEIPASLPRIDWHLLEPGSLIFAESVRKLAGQSE